MAENPEEKKLFLEVWLFAGAEFQAEAAPLFPEHYRVRYFSDSERPFELLNDDHQPAWVLAHFSSLGEQAIELLKQIGKVACAKRTLLADLTGFPKDLRTELWENGINIISPEHLEAVADTICL